MILSIAHASVSDPAADYIFGAWSDIVVGERPNGLVDCYLSKGDGVIQMVSIWENEEGHDRAINEAGNHPAYGFFEACGIDPTHTVYHVIGRLASS